MLLYVIKYISIPLYVIKFQPYKMLLQIEI